MPHGVWRKNHRRPNAVFSQENKMNKRRIKSKKNTVSQETATYDRVKIKRQ